MGVNLLDPWLPSSSFSWEFNYEVSGIIGARNNLGKKVEREAVWHKAARWIPTVISSKSSPSPWIYISLRAESSLGKWTNPKNCCTSSLPPCILISRFRTLIWRDVRTFNRITHSDKHKYHEWKQSTLWSSEASKNHETNQNLEQRNVD